MNLDPTPNPFYALECIEFRQSGLPLLQYEKYHVVICILHLHHVYHILSRTHGVILYRARCRSTIAIKFDELPVVPHKAVAEVSKTGNLLERLVVVNHGRQSESTDRSIYLPIQLSIYLPQFVSQLASQLLSYLVSELVRSVSYISSVS